MASLFAPSRAEIEVSAWTAPEFRRGGVFGALADAVGRLAEERGIPSLLFCVDSRSVAGAAIAGKLGAVLDFSEYEMVCDVDEWKRRRSSGSGTDWKGESEGPHPARRSGRRGFLPVDLSGFEVRPSLAADVDELARASVDIFGEDHVRETEEKARNFIMVSMTAPLRTQYTALLDGRIVGMCAVSAWTSPAQSKTVMLNGLGISSALRGQGLGRELLYRVMEIAAEGGAKRIALEVDSVNEAAYPLYLSAGFVQTLRTDYYRLKSASPP
jgi:ribosomal protein S18 acetylase RimI-like enzyme